jgi:hypothetical protein
MQRSTSVAWLLAGLVLAQTSFATAAPRLVESRSGLPWPSGATKPGIGFEAWRGNRLMDVYTLFLRRNNWTQVIQTAQESVSRASTLGPRLVIAVPMLPKTQKGQLERCAVGAFDPPIRSVTDAMLSAGGQALANQGKPIILRLGWEANLIAVGHPWRATGDGISWRDCFRRWVGILDPKVDHDADPLTPPQRRKRFLITWNMANRGTLPHTIENMWPGDDYVDIVGSQFYDRCPAMPENDEAAWQQRSDGIDGYGNPVGVQAWLRYARSKRKPYAVPEWGVGGPRDVCDNPGRDSPFLIRKMFEFFRANAADIAYEVYFNGHGWPDDSKGSHKLFAPEPAFPEPGSPRYLAYVQRYNPRSATMYRQLWGAGRSRP